MDFLTFLATIISGAVGGAVGGGAALWATKRTIDSDRKLLADELSAQSKETAQQNAVARALAEQQHHWDQEVRDNERQEHERERAERRRNVRILINFELKHNLVALRTYWEAYVEEPLSAAPEEKEFVERWRVIQRPLPVWEHQRWQSLTWELAEALSEDELRQVQAIHTALDTLTARRGQLAALLPEGLGRNYDTLRMTVSATQEPLSHTDLFTLVRRYVVDTGQLWQDCLDLWRTLDRSELLMTELHTPT